MCASVLWALRISFFERRLEKNVTEAPWEGGSGEIFQPVSHEKYL
jgi:hypothetical protein